MSAADENSPGVMLVEQAVSRHLRVGWWALLLFLALGIVLESMHGLKVGFYLNAANEARRLQWTLGHAHGTLLGLVNIAFALSLGVRQVSPGPWLSRASGLLIAGTVLLPGGFLLGGLFIIEGDPGPGVLLVPVGALALLGGVALVVRGLFRTP